MSAFPDTPITLLTKMVSRVTGESEASWTAFFNLYRPVIGRFAVGVGAKGDVDDIVQEVFAKLVEVFRNGSYCREKGRFRAYLATLIRNEVINRWHKAEVRAANRHVSLDNDGSLLEIGVPSETAAILDAKWRLARHAAATEHVLTKTALSQRSKDVYRAYVQEARSIDAVARAFDMPKNSVSQIKTRVERMIADYEAMFVD